MDRTHETSSTGAGSRSPGQHQSGISGPTFLPSEPSPFTSEARTAPERLGTDNRRRTLLALIDELTELRDEEREIEQNVNYAPTTNERLSSDNEGVERFQVFDERVRNLDLKLQAFANAVRRLGSSAGLLNVTYHLKARLSQIQYFFRENAAELFDSVSHGPNLGTKPYSVRGRGKLRRDASLSPTNNGKPWLDDIEYLPRELEYMAKDLQTLLDHLNDVPEFTDDAVNASIMAFEGDLKYRASCLREFEGQLKFVAVAQYINGLTDDLGVHLDNMKDSLHILIEVGAPTVRLSQKHIATGLQNLSIVATFFSGITATTLQFSHEAHGGTLSDVVIALWISSLVFSIASAINSQLAYHWHTAMYRSPRSYVPWWIAIWITRTPLFFLVGSVMAFSVGLCVFTYSSNQSLAVRAIVTTFTGITSSALLYVGFWFALERRTFAKTKGSRWLLDVLEERMEKTAEATGVATAQRAASRTAATGVKHIRTLIDSLPRSFTGTTNQTRRAPGFSEETAVEVELGTSDLPNPTLQGGNAPADSPAAMFQTSGGSRHLGVRGSVEARKLSYLDRGDKAHSSKGNWPGLGPSTERTIPEDMSLHFGTVAPLPTTRLWNAGDNSGTTESGSATGGGSSTLANAMAEFNADNGGGSLEVIEGTEKRKLSDLGKGIEFTIPEEGPLHLNTTTPITVTSQPSAGDNLGASGSNSVLTHSIIVSPELAGPVLPRNARFRALAQRALLTPAHTWEPTPQIRSPVPIRSMSATPFMSEGRHRSDSSQHQMNPTHMRSLVPMLRTLRSGQTLCEHVALVKHLQFSPDGQFLATCSWDKTALIWRVGSGTLDGFAVLHKLVHASRIGSFIGQVAWSPSGDRLLTKQLMGVKVWDTKTGVCKKTIDRKRDVQSITWMPKGSAFVSVEWRLDANSAEARKRVYHTEDVQGSDLVIMSADGGVTDDHYLPRLQVWDAAVTPDEERIVAVASLLRSKDELKPTKSRNEKRILVYNLHTKEIENQVPLLQEVRDVTLTEQGNYALVSYEHKAPPQAWRVDMITGEQKCRLVLAHTYVTKHPVDFAGPSYFGGENDMFVLCASKGGDIYIWERASGILLHSLKAPDQELTGVAWNHKSPSGFMLASATHNGLVRIWTTTAHQPPAQPSRRHASSPGPTGVEGPP